MKKKVLDSDEDDGEELGNGESVEGDRGWEDNEEGSAWNDHQEAKLYFRDIAGNSEQFSQSVSIHKADFLESRSMQDNTINIDHANTLNVLSQNQLVQILK